MKNTIDKILRIIKKSPALGCIFCVMLSITLPCFSKDSFPPLALPEIAGVNIHFTGNRTADLDMIAAAGIGVIRMDLAWSSVERTKGTYDFNGSGYDSLVYGCESRGIRLMFIIDYANDNYGGVPGLSTDEGRRGFAAFSKAAAKRYVGKRIIWEIWNEPDGSWFWPNPSAKSYTELAIAAAAAIRQEDTNSIIVGPALSAFLPYDYLETCFKNGFLNVVDGVSIHPYRDDLWPEWAFANFEYTRTLITKYAPGKNIQVLQGEWGEPNTTMNDEDQARHMVRQLLLSLLQGLPLNIWYDWKNDGTNPSSREDNFGIVENDIFPKSAYCACKVLMNCASGLAYRGRIDLGNGSDFAIRLSRGTREVIACWTSGNEHSVVIPSSQGNGSIVNMFGDESAKSWGSSGITTTLSGTPQYILVKSGSSSKPAAIEADAGAYQSVIDTDFTGSETVRLDGSASYSPDGSIASYQWLEHNLEIASGVSPEVNLPAGIHDLTLNITDPKGKTANSTVRISVQSPVVCQIKDQYKGSYLYDGNDRVSYSATVGKDEFLWIILPWNDGYFVIRNVKTGKCMNIENAKAYVELSDKVISESWWSGRWKLDYIANTNNKRIHSKWKPEQCIHVEGQSGIAQVGTIQNDWVSAMWSFERVDYKRQNPVSNNGIYRNPKKDAQGLSRSVSKTLNKRQLVFSVNNKCNITIWSLSGSVISKFALQKSFRTIDFKTPGIYFVKVADKKTGESISEKYILN